MEQTANSTKKQPLKKVLLIGESSYIGTEFKNYVHAKQDTDIEVTSVGARSGQWENKDFAGYDSVIHLAAIVHQKETADSLRLYRDINYHMPLAVAKKSRKAGVKQYIFMSTAAVYGSEAQKITKETPPNPDTLYGKSKLAAEMSLLKLKTPTFSIAIVRPPMVYGKGCKGNYTRLIKLAKTVPIFPNIRNKRSMIGITNLCEFLLLLVLNGEEGFYFPQDKELVETTKLVELIWNIYDKKGVLLNLAKPITHFIQSGFGGRVKSLSKMFGDFYYEEEMSVIDCEKGSPHYQIKNMEEELKKSCKAKRI